MGKDAQLEDLWSIARLDAVALALSGVACYDAEVCACDGEDGAAVLGIRVELVLVGRDGGHVRHSDGRGGAKGSKRGVRECFIENTNGQRGAA
jgi:hypothetical protein